MFGRKKRTKNEDRKQNVIEVKLCKSKRKENKEKRKEPKPKDMIWLAFSQWQNRDIIDSWELKGMG